MAHASSASLHALGQHAGCLGSLGSIASLSTLAASRGAGNANGSQSLAGGLSALAMGGEQGLGGVNPYLYNAYLHAMLTGQMPVQLPAVDFAGAAQAATDAQSNSAAFSQQLASQYSMLAQFSSLDPTIGAMALANALALSSGGASGLILGGTPAAHEGAGLALPAHGMSHMSHPPADLPGQEQPAAAPADAGGAQVRAGGDVEAQGDGALTKAEGACAAHEQVAYQQPATAAAAPAAEASAAVADEQSTVPADAEVRPGLKPSPAAPCCARACVRARAFTERKLTHPLVPTPPDPSACAHAAC